MNDGVECLHDKGGSGEHTAAGLNQCRSIRYKKNKGSDRTHKNAEKRSSHRNQCLPSRNICLSSGCSHRCIAPSDVLRSNAPCQTELNDCRKRSSQDSPSKGACGKSGCEDHMHSMGNAI